ncbi:transcription cofactor vestigial-like protein 1 [Aplochiton taeniatus]
MAGCSGSPVAVKMEEQSQGVIFTYFKGDIGSMVDQHFHRALSKDKKKSNKNRKSVKSEEPTSCQWSGPSTESWSEGHLQSVSRRLQLNSPTEPHPNPPLPLGSPDTASASWSSYSPRQSGGLGLIPISYPPSLPPNGLSLTGQQYASSLLNLLHSDRSEVSPGIASGSKPDFLPSWTGHPGFRDPMDPAGGLESGRSVDKKDLYWY